MKLRIGNTPLLPLNRIGANLPARIWVKLEYLNPFGSSKDRVAWALLRSAERSRLLSEGTPLLAATSGNLGVSLATLCAQRGYSLTLVLPSNVDFQILCLLRLLGCKTLLSPAQEGVPGARSFADQYARRHRKHLYLCQFADPSNREVHARTTGREIWRATRGKIDCIVASLGSGGTLTGIASVLIRKNPEIQVIGVLPDSGELAPPSVNLDLDLIQTIERVPMKTSMKMTQALIKREGILAGPTSGAAVAAAMKYASKKSNSGKTVVAILPSSLERQLSLFYSGQEQHSFLRALAQAKPPRDILLSK